MKAHKHAALIKQWADGVGVERCQLNNRWVDDAHPTWHPDVVYRIKPEPVFKPNPGYLVLVSDGRDGWVSRTYIKMTEDQLRYFCKDAAVHGLAGWLYCKPHPLQVERDMLAAKCDERGVRLGILWNRLRHFIAIPEHWDDWFDEEGNAK